MAAAWKYLNPHIAILEFLSFAAAPNVPGWHCRTIRSCSHAHISIVETIDIRVPKKERWIALHIIDEEF